jgi:DNA-binding NarL/FixJ family response regulator
MSVITILVVDDAEHWRKFVSFILRIDPAMTIVSEASDGTQAVQEAKQHQPTIVLLDIGLPGINGIEAGWRILREAPNSKIIYVSQESDIEVVQEALAVGAAGYVSKIDAGSQLVEAINSAMRGQRFISTSLSPTAGTKH